MTSPLSRTRRLTSDPRFHSQIAYAQAALLLTLREGSPSFSQIVRRAMSHYTSHLAAMIDAGRDEGLRVPRTRDIEAERQACREHGRIADARPPRGLFNADGSLMTWSESVS